MKSRTKRKKQLDFDAALLDMLRSAERAAENIVSLAPNDRPVTAEELRSVETFVTNAVVAECREHWRVQGVSSNAIALFAKPLEDQFKRAFSERFYAMAPLAGMSHGGHA